MHEPSGAPLVEGSDPEQRERCGSNVGSDLTTGRRLATAKEDIILFIAGEQLFIQGPDLGQRGRRGRVEGSDLTTRTGSQRPKTHFLYFCLLFQKTLENPSKSYNQFQNHEKNIGKVTKSNKKS